MGWRGVENAYVEMPDDDSMRRPSDQAYPKHVFMHSYTRQTIQLNQNAPGWNQPFIFAAKAKFTVHT